MLSHLGLTAKTKETAMPPSTRKRQKKIGTSPSQLEEKRPVSQQSSLTRVEVDGKSSQELHTTIAGDRERPLEIFLNEESKEEAEPSLSIALGILSLYAVAIWTLLTTITH
jgi:hypothetical protein